MRNFFVALVLGLLAACVADGAEFRGSIVRLRANQLGAFEMLSARTALLMSGGARQLATDPGLAVVDSDPEEALGNLAVEEAYPNYVRRVLGDPGRVFDDPPALPWGISKVGAPKLWGEGIAGSRRVLVAVIDTGIDYTHPALAANVWTGPNGEHGYDFANKDADPMDDHSHGTHCSGTIGGEGVGINKEVSIMGVKFLSKDGSGTDADAIEAINFAAANGAQVLSNSWGGGGYDALLEDAIRKAGDKGALFIAAAGNEYNDNDKEATYPAGFKLPNVIAVAATGQDDAKASFSNWGAKTVHVAAPGVKVLSTVLGGKYAEYSGTSMATPHVSGVAAMMLSRGMDPAAVRKALIKTSDAVAALSAKVVAKGRVNAYAAVKAAE
jgi:subtilisin family serine protease